VKSSANFDIHLSNVRVVLPNNRELFAISDFLIPYGSHVLIQGESGSGKTTFLHLIAGLFSPQLGHVSIGDIRIDSLDDNARCELRMNTIGVIFQKLNLLDHLTVAENISLSLAPETKDRELRIYNAIDRVNLKGHAGDRCSFLSLGEQQRVAVARVLAQEPRIILADEPTSSLDEKSGDFVMNALKDAAKGRTLVVVSHDLRISRQFDKVIPFREFTS